MYWESSKIECYIAFGDTLHYTVAKKKYIEEKRPKSSNMHMYDIEKDNLSYFLNMN